MVLHAPSVPCVASTAYKPCVGQHNVHHGGQNGKHLEEDMGDQVQNEH